MNSDEVDPQATQFAITNLNVPDRLDLRDMDDRKQADESKRLRLEGIVRWTVRLVLGLVLVGVVVGGIEIYGMWRNTISAASLSERLSTALGLPVTVEGTQVALSPAPRLVIRKIALADKATIDEVSIGLGIQGLSEIIRGKGVHWGEALVHSAHFTPQQGGDLLQLLPRLGSALPRGVTVLKFDRLEVDGQTWLKGAASLSTSRDSDGNFTQAVLQQQLNKGSLRLQLSPVGPGPDPAIRFQLDAKNWGLPFGATFPQEDVVALGELDASHLEVSQYSIGGPFGLVQGRLMASRGERGWTLDGTSNTDALDLEALIRMIVSVPDDEKETRPPTLIQGTAAFSGRIEGKGESLEESFGKASFSAPIIVRWAILNGVDLGYVATHPGSTGGTGGGITRFTSLEASVLAGGDRIRVSGIRGKAGALLASGGFVLEPDRELFGSVRVDIGLVRVQTPIRVDIRGNLLKPVYGR